MQVLASYPFSQKNLNTDVQLASCVIATASMYYVDIKFSSLGGGEYYLYLTIDDVPTHFEPIVLSAQPAGKIFQSRYVYIPSGATLGIWARNLDVSFDSSVDGEVVIVNVDNGVTIANIAERTQHIPDMPATQAEVAVVGEAVVALGEPMQAEDYTAPDNASIAAIKVKTDNLPADPAGVSDIPTVQNIDSQLSERHGGGSWGVIGDGDIAVDHNFGGEDELRITDLNDNGVDDVKIRAYLKSEYDLGQRVIRGAAVTAADGRWVTPMYLNAATYVLAISHPSFVSYTVEITVS